MAQSYPASFFAASSLGQRVPSDYKPKTEKHLGDHSRIHVTDLDSAHTSTGEKGKKKKKVFNYYVSDAQT